MKFIFSLGLLLSVSMSYGQSTDETLEGTEHAIKMSTIGTGVGVGITLVAITLNNTQNRGVAEREQMKDEMVQLNEDMRAGLVKNVGEVRQPTLRAFFEEITHDEEDMEKINKHYKGSQLEKLTTALTVNLLT